MLAAIPAGVSSHLQALSEITGTRRNQITKELPSCHTCQHG